MLYMHCALFWEVKPLAEQEGVSTVMVIGGSGDFFPLADTVIMMERYAASDVTAQAHAIAEKYARSAPSSVPGVRGAERVLLKQGLGTDGKVPSSARATINLALFAS